MINHAVAGVVWFVTVMGVTLGFLAHDAYHRPPPGGWFNKDADYTNYASNVYDTTDSDSRTRG